MKIAFLESFYGGSHKNFLDGLAKYSAHEIVPVTLPARFWKWRLRCSALYFAEQFADELPEYDLLLVTDMFNLAEFKALTGFTCPSIMFFHENQVSYPLPERDSPDPSFALTNLVSALTADANLFNSSFQFGHFTEELPKFINKIPEFVPYSVCEQVIKKSRVIYMGCDFGHFVDVTTPHNDVPTVLWNHRWEFDKQPHLFFQTLYALADEGVPFQVVILGENFQVHPREFLEARERLNDRILHFGFVESREDYANFLKMADVVVSTAIQENFGFAVAEAIYCHTLPLLPARLSYPELLEKRFHKTFLYKNDDELLSRLRYLLQHYRNYDNLRADLSASITRFDWKNRITEFDQLFSDIVKSRSLSPKK